jgi:hypothetical protein
MDNGPLLGMFCFLKLVPFLLLPTTSASPLVLILIAVAELLHHRPCLYCLVFFVLISMVISPWFNPEFFDHEDAAVIGWDIFSVFAGTSRFRKIRGDADSWWNWMQVFGSFLFSPRVPVELL